MARKPLLMMRARGLTGPLFARHAGVPGLSKAGFYSGAVINVAPVTHNGVPVTHNAVEVTHG